MYYIIEDSDDQKCFESSRINLKVAERLMDIANFLISLGFLFAHSRRYNLSNMLHDANTISHFQICNLSGTKKANEFSPIS